MGEKSRTTETMSRSWPSITARGRMLRELSAPPLEVIDVLRVSGHGASSAAPPLEPELLAPSLLCPLRHMLHNTSPARIKLLPRYQTLSLYSIHSRPKVLAMAATYQTFRMT